MSGEASRAQPGEATLQVVVKTSRGRKSPAERWRSHNSGGDTLPFSTNIAVAPGSYIVRLGVMDSAGRVGSVDHRVDVRDVPLGALSATGPVLVAVPAGRAASRGSRWRCRQDERLALEVDLGRTKGRLDECRVRDCRPRRPGALLHAPAALVPGPREGAVIAQGVPTCGLPPGEY